MGNLIDYLRAVRHTPKAIEEWGKCCYGSNPAILAPPFPTAVEKAVTGS